MYIGYSIAVDAPNNSVRSDLIIIIIITRTSTTTTVPSVVVDGHVRFYTSYKPDTTAAVTRFRAILCTLRVHFNPTAASARQRSEFADTQISFPVNDVFKNQNTLFLSRFSLIFLLLRRSYT